MLPVSQLTLGSKMISKSARIPDPKCPYRNPGLSSKEKSFVICNCQSKSKRYVQLKSLAMKAIKEHKIFTIYGSSCNVLRKELVSRGWVEKCPDNQMNLSKLRTGVLKTQTQIDNELERLLLSNFVSKNPPNFIWHGTEENGARKVDRDPNGTTIENRLKTGTTWTTKHGLCSSMKRNYWFYIEDVAEVTAPRSYNTYDVTEVEDFENDYKITACTSLLKWILSMVASQQPIFSASGKISTNILVFALSRCKEYLFRKQNRDIDRRINSISECQWDTFIRNYYLLVDRKEVFHTDVEEKKLKLYLGYTKFFLREIFRYRPQLKCEGCHNIWIMKPSHDCRGRGIKMASNLAVITDVLQNGNNSKYVIQKYIEEPLLIYETKFDIRQYYLVTSTYPLVIWMYEDCYLKFSSQKYNLLNFHESIHLTNNAIQRKYTNCSGRHSNLPKCNMWDVKTYKDYLNSIGQQRTWDEVIYPGMRKAIIGIMLSCQDSMTLSKNRYELYGCDFILDKSYTPWLIEINSCPDLHNTTPVTSKICPAVISDIVKVVIDYKIDQNASTGKFECIYHQPTTPQRFGNTDLCVKGYSLPASYFYRGPIPEATYSYDFNFYTDKNNEIVAFDQLERNKVTIDYERDGYLSPVNQFDNDANDSDESLADLTIASQLEKLMAKITSDNNISSDDLSQTDSINSVNKIETALKNSLSRIASAVLDCCITTKRGDPDMLQITEGRDETLDEENIVSGDRINEILEYYKMTSAIIQTSLVPVSSNTTHKMAVPRNIVFEATSNIVKFINKTEREYMNIIEI